MLFWVKKNWIVSVQTNLEFVVNSRIFVYKLSIYKKIKENN